MNRGVLLSDLLIFKKPSRQSHRQPRASSAAADQTRPGKKEDGGAASGGFSKQDDGSQAWLRLRITEELLVNINHVTEGCCAQLSLGRSWEHNSKSSY